MGLVPVPKNELKSVPDEVLIIADNYSHDLGEGQLLHFFDFAVTAGDIRAERARRCFVMAMAEREKSAAAVAQKEHQSSGKSDGLANHFQNIVERLNSYPKECHAPIEVTVTQQEVTCLVYMYLTTLKAIAPEKNNFHTRNLEALFRKLGFLGFVELDESYFDN